MSPDLAPLKNIWAELKHVIHVQQSRQALIQEWNNIPQNDVANAICSIRRRRIFVFRLDENSQDNDNV